MTRNYSNVAEQTTLSSGINSSATTLAVGSVTGYPAGPATLIIDPGLASEELVEYANISGTSFTGCTRGVDGTPATSHSTGATVVHGTSARDFREPNDHATGTTSVHGIANTASLVTLTGTQTLTNKTLTSPTVGAPSITNPTITSGGSWAGGPTISSPTISTPSITNPTITSGGSWAGSPTLTTPTIADLTNMQHTHTGASSGGTINSGFYFGRTVVTGSYTQGSSSYTDLTSLSMTFTAPSAWPTSANAVCVVVTVVLGNDWSSTTGYVVGNVRVLLDGSTALDNPMQYSRPYQLGDTADAWTGIFFGSLPSTGASHTYKVQANQTSASGTNGLFVGTRSITAFLV